ncbi:hypothetical protein [Sessilibacter corallicola]|uniref:Uncharacterized protein n=1 Tax=Sessilibacter corallicola TaxID=2904075 RepID=A0ABQ0A9K0_9GAMM
MTIYDLGFTEKNVESLTKRYDSAARSIYMKQTEAILNKHEPGLKTLMEEVGFTTENITSILNGSGNKLDEAVRGLTDNQTIQGLKALQSDIGLEAKNLSGILGTSRRYVSNAVKTMSSENGIQTLKDIKKEYDLTPISLSSLLMKRGRNIGEELEALGSERVKGTFHNLQDLGFSSKSITSLLGRLSGGIEERFELAQEKMTELSAMTGVMEPQAISSKLSKMTGKLDKRVDELYEKLLNEIEGDFSVVSSSVASSSQATEAKKNRNR